MKRKKLLLFLLVTVSAIIILTGCNDKVAVETKWDVSVTIPKNSDAVVKSDVAIKTQTGKLSVRNLSGTDLKAYVYDSDDGDKMVKEIYLDGGTADEIFNLDDSKEYTLGFKGAVDKDSYVNIELSDYVSSAPT